MGLKYFALLIIVSATAHTAVAQERITDQNPACQESRQHYMLLSDSLTQTHGTTVQQTYKAYDFLQLKQEKKDQRREWRQERRMQRAVFGDTHYYRPFHSYGYGRPYYGGFSGTGWMEYLTLTSVALGLYSLFH